MKKTHSFALLSACSAALILAGCSDGASLEDPIADPGQTSPRVNLQTLGDSEAFYDALQSALINQSDAGGYGFSGGDDADLTLEASESASDSGAGASPSGNEVSSTNVQEIGVDEQDRVKVDAGGELLYVLHTDYEDLVYLPVDSNVESSPADIPIDSEYVPPSPKTVLRILSLDSETPDATEVNELDIDIEGFTADGLYLHETDSQASLIVTAFGSNYWDAWSSSSYFGGTKGLIAKYDVQDAANAEMVQTITIDGQIVSSRRIGDTLFFASRHYPQIPDVNYWEEDAESWRAAVEAADLSELMPHYHNSETDQSEPLADASACFVAPVSDDQPYYSPDIITLGVIDLSTMQLRDSECFLGSTETLYANTESVFLATTQYDYTSGPVTTDDILVDPDDREIDADISWFDPRTSTDIHQFDINGDQLDYRGSGSVDGHLGWNPLQKPFRMSERDGYLRVATINDSQGQGHSPILMHVLRANDNNELQLVSSLPNEQRPKHIGEPGETLYASRFIGDRAYLVTFRQTDPLYVIDLADPADPEVKGELKIDGYSDYLHPIEDGLLLGIGKDAVPAEQSEWGDGRGAWVQGIKLALFDVSDPQNPTEIRSVLVGERGTYAAALADHRAITVQSATELHPTRVSFGISVHGDAEPSASSSETPWEWEDYNYRGLHGFDIVGGANADIVPVGAMVIHRASDDPQLSYFVSNFNERSVMVNDAVFYISRDEVYPALWDNLTVTPQAR